VQLDRNVLSTAKVQEFLSKNFISVKLDANRPYAKAVLKQYNAPGIPCLLVYTPQGQLRSMKVGAPSNSDSFIRTVSAMVRGK